MSLRRSIVALSLLAGASALSACGGGGSSAPDYTIPADAGLVVKAVPTIRWDAKSYVASAGDVKVFLANDDNVKHVMVVRQGNKVVGDLELVAADAPEGASSIGVFAANAADLVPHADGFIVGTSGGQ